MNNISYQRISNKTCKKNVFSFDYQEYYGSSNHYSGTLKTKNSVDELGKLVKNDVIFNNIGEYAKQRKIAEEFAKAIEEEIKTRMHKLKDFRDNVEKTLKENLFAEPSFKASITGNIDAVEKGLEDALDHLGAQRNRYSNPLYESLMADLKSQQEQSM